MTCARRAISLGTTAFVAGLGIVGLGLLVLASGSCTGTPSAGEPQSSASQCHLDGDCPLGQICSLGECVDGCRPGGGHCPDGTGCLGGQCVPYPDPDAGPPADGGALDCPDDMVRVGDLFCIDRYEASRPDATDILFGDDESKATSRPDVLPWFPVVKESAALACALAGKRLCTPGEFEMACRGPDASVYSYGDVYDPALCNGIDTYCACGSDSLCEDVAECPYPHCYDSPPAGQALPAGGCGAIFRAKPTGSFEQCLSGYGAVDINGNVWELVDDGSDEGEFRGGAYNCKDSETLHRCDYVATAANARGFRCCR